MNPLTTAIKTIIEGQNLVYLRTVNINDLNEQVGNVDLTSGAGIYTSTPAIENIQYVGGNVTQRISIEIYFLKLNQETDDKGEAIDVILDELKPKADAFYDKMTSNPITSLTDRIEGYELDAVETIKLSKEVLTGWRLRMRVPIDRTKYYCGIQDLVDSDGMDLIDLDNSILVG